MEPTRQPHILEILICFGVLTIFNAEVTNTQVLPAPKSVYWFSNASIIWKQPEFSSNNVKYYQVTVACNKTGTFQANTTDTMLQVDIRRDQCCYLKVYGVNNAGDGLATEKTMRPYIANQIYYKIPGYDLERHDSTVTISWTTNPYMVAGTIYKFVVSIESWALKHHVHSTIVCHGPKCRFPCDYKVTNSTPRFDQDQKRFYATLPVKPAALYTTNIRLYAPNEWNRKMAGIRQFTTSAKAPTSPVEEVAVLDIGMTAVNVSWFAPKQSNGRINTYNVSLSHNKQNCSSSKDEDDYLVPVTLYKSLRSSSNNKYMIDDLQPYTFYTMTVNAINGGGHGLNWSVPITFKTQPKGVEEEVRNLKITVDSRFIQMTWTTPCPIQEPINGYSIEVMSRGQLYLQFETNDTSMNITNLQPYTYYTVRIRGLESGVYSSFETLTKMDVPGHMETMYVNQNSDINKLQGLDIHWSPPQQSNGPIIGYLITLTNDCFKQEIKTIQTNKTQLSFSDPLHPDCNYTLKLQAINNAGNGPGIVRHIYIKPIIPMSAVQEMEVLGIDMTRAKFVWFAPKQSNGKIDAYNVSLSYNKQNCLSSILEDDYFLPVTYYKSLLSSSDNKYTIDDLQPFTLYTMKVNAINKAGHGLNWSKVITFKTHPIRAKTKVRNLHTVLETRVIQLTWSLPCPLQEPINGYSIEVFNRDGELYVQIETNDTSMNVTNLQPYTFYTIHIRGVDSGIYSSFEMRTQMEVPGKVTSLLISQQVEENKSRRLILYWIPPEQSNSLIFDYLLTLTNDCFKQETQQIKTNKTMLSLPVFPECNYTVELQASNSVGFGPKNVQYIYINPLEHEKSTQNSTKKTVMIAFVVCIAVIVILAGILLLVKCSKKVYRNRNETKNQYNFEKYENESIEAVVEYNSNNEAQ